MTSSTVRLRAVRPRPSASTAASRQAPPRYQCALSCGKSFPSAQSKDQQKCINEGNKNFAKVAKQQGKANLSCLKNAGKDKLGAMSIEECLVADVKGKVGKAMAKTLDKVSQKCSVEFPNFGGVDPTGAAVNQAAVLKELSLIHALLGSDLDQAGLVVRQDDDKVAQKCQETVAKLAQKCQDTKLKLFNVCKKKALKGSKTESPVTSGQELQDACLGVGTAPMPDPKGKIKKICVTKLDLTIGKKCPPPLDLDALFPGCAGEDLGDCVDRRVECEVCLALDTVDGLERDCDELDDGVANQSCGEIEPICGDGVLDPGEECDPPEDSACPGACQGDCTCPLCIPTAEVCDGLDNDCDGAADEGNPGGGAACNTGLPGVCSSGTMTCQAGALVCVQDEPPSPEVCDGLDNDCDGFTDEGLQNDNPSCSSGTTYIGSVSGDTGGDQRTHSDSSEEWIRFRVTEDDNGIAYLSATVVLYSPPGVDYDLYVYCNSCGGGLAGSSTVRGLTGHWDNVEVRTNDDWLFSDDFDVVVEVRYFNASTCASWELSARGNTNVSMETCN